MLCRGAVYEKAVRKDLDFHSQTGGKIDHREEIIIKKRLALSRND